MISNKEAGQRNINRAGWTAYAGVTSLVAGVTIWMIIFGIVLGIKYFWQGLTIAIVPILGAWLAYAIARSNYEIENVKIADMIKMHLTHETPYFKRKGTRPDLPPPILKAIEKWNKYLADNYPWAKEPDEPEENPWFNPQIYEHHKSLSFDEMTYFHKHIKQEHMNKFCVWYELQPEEKKKVMLDEMKIIMNQIKIDIYDGKHKR